MEDIHVDSLNDAVDALETMENLVYELDNFFRRKDNIVYERWRGYVKSHIQMALSNEHEFIGSNMFTLRGLLTDIENCDDDDDSELADEDESENGNT